MMKRLLLLGLGLIFVVFTHAQKPQILNTRVSLSPSSDSLIVHYDLSGRMPVINVALEITDAEGNPIDARSITGDVGNVLYAGKDKTIFWNMRADNMLFYGKTISARVTADAVICLLADCGSYDDRDRYFPWLLVASGITYAIGGGAWYLANEEFNRYPDFDRTAAAEDSRQRVEKYDMVRNIAFGAATALGIAGTIVHIRHKKQKKEKENELSFMAVPVSGGGAIAIRYTF